MKIEKFEDFVAWQEARMLTSDIYKVTSQGEFAKDYGLKDQIRRASVSIMSNIAEGFERGRPAEFHQFLSISKASCAELRSQLYVSRDVGYLSESTFNSLMVKANKVAQLLGGLRKSVEQRRNLS